MTIELEFKESSIYPNAIQANYSNYICIITVFRPAPNEILRWVIMEFNDSKRGFAKYITVADGFDITLELVKQRIREWLNLILGSL